MKHWTMSLREYMGKRISKAREGQELSQLSLAKALNVQRQTLSNWERGKTEPDGEQLLKIASECNVSISFLYGQDDDELTPKGKQIGLIWSKFSPGKQDFGLEISLAISMAIEREEMLIKAPNSTLSKI